MLKEIMYSWETSPLYEQLWKLHHGVGACSHAAFSVYHFVSLTRHATSTGEQPANIIFNEVMLS
jgi:hypothetical protein